MLYLNCEVSEAQIEPHDVTGVPPISPDQPAHVRIGPLNEWVQITYGMLRSSPHGDDLAAIDSETGFWTLAHSLPILSATRHDGSHYHILNTPEGWLFTDIIITEEAA